MNTAFVIATTSPLEVDIVIAGPDARQFAIAHVADLRDEFSLKAAVFVFSGERAAFASDKACDLIAEGKPFGRRALRKLEEEFDVLSGIGFDCMAAAQ